VSEEPRIVILGAGFAGLRAARALRGAEADVTVVDRHNFQTFQPLLYQVATAALNEADVAFPVRGVLRRYGNARFRLGTVVALDDGAVRLDDGSSLPYDHLIVTAGARAAFFGVPGAERHAFPLYALVDATRLRNHVLRCFEAADADPSLIDDGALTFVVVGGGPTGVEIAGALAELFDGVLRKDFPQIDASRARVLLVEMQDTVLPQFSERSQRHALKALRARRVDVRFGAKVERVGARAIDLVGGERIASRTVVWAAGVQPAPVADWLGAERTRGGRIVVEPDLTVRGRTNVFAAGDIAAAADPDGTLYPQLGAVAIQTGEHVARQVMRRIRGEATEPFVYRDKGIMATIGRRSAVAELSAGIRLSGTIGWLAWLFLHLLLLVGFRNRLSVLLNWAWSYIVRERGPRIVLEVPPVLPEGEGEDLDTG
jgi:NADH:ubiquinone reductase (H+-translocating)